MNNLSIIFYNNFYIFHFIISLLLITYSLLILLFSLLRILFFFSLFSSLFFFCQEKFSTNSYCRQRKVMKNFQNNLLRFVGFIFFYASDSALIMYHVGYKFPFAEIIILLTYFVAQYLIVWGTCKTHRLAIISKKMK